MITQLKEVQSAPEYHPLVWRLYRKYQNDAKRRELGFSISYHTFSELITQDCHYCGLSHKDGKISKRGNRSITYNGIDRKNSMAGYTEENELLPCCHACNMAKKDAPYDDFVGWLNRVAKYRA